MVVRLALSEILETEVDCAVAAVVVSVTVTASYSEKTDVAATPAATVRVTRGSVTVTVWYAVMVTACTG